MHALTMKRGSQTAAKKKAKETESKTRSTAASKKTAKKKTGSTAAKKKTGGRKRLVIVENTASRGMKRPMNFDFDEEFEGPPKKRGKTAAKASRKSKSAKTDLAWQLLAHRKKEADAKEAVSLLEERVKKNDYDAMWMLGVCCEFGIGCGKLKSRATSLYRQCHLAGTVFGDFLVESRLDKPIGTGAFHIRDGLFQDLKSFPSC